MDEESFCHRAASIITRSHLKRHINLSDLYCNGRLMSLCFFLVFFLSFRLRCSAPFVKRGRVCHSFFLPESSRIMQVKSGISHKKHNSPALSSLWVHLHPHLEQAATTLLFFPFFSQLRQIILSLSQCQAAGLCCMNFLLEEKKKEKVSLQHGLARIQTTFPC